MQTAQCVGKTTTGVENTQPIASVSMDILGTETQLNVNPAGETLDGTSKNFYSTVEVTMTFAEDSRNYADKRIVSYIQKDQKNF